MNKADELKEITRRVLGEEPGRDFYVRTDLMLDEALTKAGLVLATKEIEKTVKFFVSVEDAKTLKKRYREFFVKNPSYV